MMQINGWRVTMTKEDLDELNGEVAKGEEMLAKIEKLIDEILSDRTGKLDWYKSYEGSRILEIKGILNGE